MLTRNKPYSAAKPVRFALLKFHISFISDKRETLMINLVFEIDRFFFFIYLQFCDTASLMKTIAYMKAFCFLAIPVK